MKNFLEKFFKLWNLTMSLLCHYSMSLLYVTTMIIYSCVAKYRSNKNFYHYHLWACGLTGPSWLVLLLGFSRACRWLTTYWSKWSLALVAGARWLVHVASNWCRLLTRKSVGLLTRILFATQIVTRSEREAQGLLTGRAAKDWLGQPAVCSVASSAA